MSLLGLFSRVQILKYNYYISVTHLYDESDIDLAKVLMNDVVIELVMYDINKNRSSLNNQKSLCYHLYPPHFDFSHSYQSLVH